jgi:hypothetical protein
MYARRIPSIFRAIGVTVSGGGGARPSVSHNRRVHSEVGSQIVRHAVVSDGSAHNGLTAIQGLRGAVTDVSS